MQANPTANPTFVSYFYIPGTPQKGQIVIKAWRPNCPIPGRRAPPRRCAFLFTSTVAIAQTDCDEAGVFSRMRASSGQQTPCFR